MTKVIHLPSPHAGTRVHLSAPSPTFTKAPTPACVGPAPACGVGTVAQQAAIENSLYMALYFLRQPGDNAANLWAATARTNRALSMLKHASGSAVATSGRA